MTITPDTPDLIGVAAAAEIAGISEAAMRKHVARGTCPPPLPVDGSEALVWQRQTVIDWAASRPRRGQRGGTLDQLLAPTTSTAIWWDVERDLGHVGPVWAVLDDGAEWSPERRFPHRPDEQPITRYDDLDQVIDALLAGIVGDDGTGYLASQMLIWTSDPTDEQGRLWSRVAREPEGTSYQVTEPPDYIIGLAPTVSGAARHGAPLAQS